MHNTPIDVVDDEISQTVEALRKSHHPHQFKHLRKERCKHLKKKGAKDLPEVETCSPSIHQEKSTLWWRSRMMVVTQSKSSRKISGRNHLTLTILASLELITEYRELEDSSQDVGREEIKHAGGKISIYDLTLNILN